MNYCSIWKLWYQTSYSKLLNVVPLYNNTGISMELLGSVKVESFTKKPRDTIIVLLDFLHTCQPKKSLPSFLIKNRYSATGTASLLNAKPFIINNWKQMLILFFLNHDVSHKLKSSSNFCHPPPSPCPESYPIHSCSSYQKHKKTFKSNQTHKNPIQNRYKYRTQYF